MLLIKLFRIGPVTGPRLAVLDRGREVDKFRAFYYQPVDNIWRETYKPPVDVRCYILDTTVSLCNGSAAPQKMLSLCSCLC